MNVSFKASFTKDLRAIKDIRLLARVEKAILNVERAPSMDKVHNQTSLKGWQGYHRIRIGDYRLGVSVEGDTVSFVRVLHRREAYRYFP